jgi:lipopolysaccharide transport system ATP-binding protein
MYVRLAFAVAAFLEPDILIVDEVLAVGDAEFQKKAIGKMQDISRGQGRTVLFVSHNMAAVKSLCTRGIILEHGKVVLQDTIENVISHYLKGRGDAMNIKKYDEAFDKEAFKLNVICLKNESKTIIDPLYESDVIELLTDIDIKDAEPLRYHITYHLHNEMGEAMFSFSSGTDGVSLKQGNNQLKCFFPKDFFQSGQYFLSLYVIKDKREAVFVNDDIISFSVVDRIREIGVYMGREPGYIRPAFIWENQS